jgi:hypothetical protein
VKHGEDAIRLVRDPFPDRSAVFSAAESAASTAAIRSSAEELSILFLKLAMSIGFLFRARSPRSGII